MIATDKITIHYIIWCILAIYDICERELIRSNPFPNFNGVAVDVWGWISNFIPLFVEDVIIYPVWDQS